MTKTIEELKAVIEVVKKEYPVDEPSSLWNFLKQKEIIEQVILAYAQGDAPEPESYTCAVCKSIERGGE